VAAHPSEDIVRKFVVGLVAVLAVFVFIQSYSGAEATNDGRSFVEARAEIIP
jgi:hypothetical protein